MKSCDGNRGISDGSFDDPRIEDVRWNETFAGCWFVRGERNVALEFFFSDDVWWCSLRSLSFSSWIFKSHGAQ